MERLDEVAAEARRLCAGVLAGFGSPEDAAIPGADWQPYDRSVLWTIHDAYFAARGRAAWTAGDIPFVASSNYAISREHARFAIRLVADLERAGRLDRNDAVYLLEVGCGAGHGAAQFLRALEHGTGPAGRALLVRLRYVLSDFVEASVREAAASPALRRHVAAGRVLLAQLDLRRPDQLRLLDGGALPRPFSLVLASYVCCVSPTRIIHLHEDGCAEKQVRVAGSAAGLLELLADPTRPGLLDSLAVETRWHPADLDDLLPDSIDKAVVRLLAEGLGEATIPYPQVFVDFLRAIAPRVLAGGAVLIADYGSDRRGALRGRHEHAARHYGNSLNHSVSFPLFDAVGAVLGWSVVRTRGDRGLHVAAIRFAREPVAGLARAFRRIYVGSAEGELVTDLRAAVRAHRELDQHDPVIRLCRRLLRIDPRDPQTRFWIGSACLELGQPRRALRHFRLAEGWPEADLAAGRALHALGRVDDAVDRYRRALARHESPDGYVALAAALWDQGQHGPAYRAVETALACEPDHALARRMLTELEMAWLALLKRPSEEPAAETPDLSWLG